MDAPAPSACQKLASADNDPPAADLPPCLIGTCTHKGCDQSGLCRLLMVE